MWSIPGELDGDIKTFARNLSCDYIQAIPVDYHSAYDYDNCHNNVEIHTEIYGGESIVGWYFVKGFDTIQAIRHTVWNNGKELIDVTPFVDRRQYNIFAKSKNQTKDYSIPNCYIQSLAKYLTTPETEVMYYVYQLVDPRNNQPFYIGKGKGRRAKTHLWEVPETRNVYKENKINSIRQAGLEPKIEYIAENIIDEQLAYDIESSMIQKYGRKGYDENGILSNICIDNRPPNHKGKSYEQIYGSEKAQQQRDLRSRLQKERGGYGPKQHTEETKKRISEQTSGKNNPMFGKNHNDSSKQKIGEANSKYVGKLNKKSKVYKLTSPSNEEYILYGGELGQFCLENNLSRSTLKNQIRKNNPWNVPSKGKTRGWKLEVIEK